MARQEPIICSRCEVRRRGIFRALEDEHFPMLDAEKSVAHFHAGQVLCAEGAPGGPVYCMHRGLVKLMKTGDRGEPQILRLLAPPETIGVRTLVADDSYPATAVAAERTVVCVIPRETFRKLLRRSQGLSGEIMARLSREVRQAEDRMLAFTQRSARRRLAHLLLYIEEHDRERGDGSIHQLLKRKDLARMVGMTPETFSRLLRQFRDRRLIEVTRREIRLLDREGVRRVATKDGLYIDGNQEYY